MGKHGGKLGNNKEKTWKTQRDKQVVMFFILDLYRFINLNKFCGVKSPGKSVVCIMSSRWWWLEHEFYDFPFSRECHNPNWRTHIFQIYIIIYIYIILLYHIFWLIWGDEHPFTRHGFQQTLLFTSHISSPCARCWGSRSSKKPLDYDHYDLPLAFHGLGDISMETWNQWEFQDPI